MFDAKDSVLVIGVGRSGLATAEVLRKRGVSVFAYDDKDPAQLEKEREELAKLGVALIDASKLRDVAGASSGAVLSPGIPLTSPAALAVAAAGAPVYSEIEVAYRISPAPIVAVTGTKGKSTTASLIGHLLKTAGKSVRIGGNIGNPLIRETDRARADDIIIAEVSSFQLESIRAFRPRVSVLLNISPDHLDRYPSMDEYAEAKFRIFANQGPDDAFVGNADDEYGQRLIAGGWRTIPSAAHWFSVDGHPKAEVLVFGDSIALKETKTAKPTKIIRTDELKLIGDHNIANALAAALAARLSGAPIEALRLGLLSFEPLPHRLQAVATLDGVTWIDDSKASTPSAVIAALETFEQPLILIAGGRSKKTDFAEMGEAISQRAKAVVFFGEAAHEMGGHVRGVTARYAGSMQESVAAAASLAAPGDVVVMSPGGTSFDMFESAEQRGEAFARCVGRLRKPRRRAVVDRGAR